MKSQKTWTGFGYLQIRVSKNDSVFGGSTRSETNKTNISQKTKNKNQSIELVWTVLIIFTKKRKVRDLTLEKWKMGFGKNRSRSW